MMSTYIVTRRRVELLYILYGLVIFTSESIRKREELQHVGNLLYLDDSLTDHAKLNSVPQ